MTRSMPTDASLPDSVIEAALRSLRTAAPTGLATTTLVAVGLADEFAPLDTVLGPVFVAWNGLGISAVDRVDAVGPVAGEIMRARLEARTGRPARVVAAIPEPLRGAIERRLAGDRRVRIPLDWRDRGPFERAVWSAALEIPRGEVRPYGWVAARIGHPGAVRAVGSALGRNPVPLIVPCHRVVRSDGTIGEYSLGGRTEKQAILLDEGVDVVGLARLGSAGVRYIGSDTTRIFCLPTCQHARRIGSTHRRPFHSAAEATAAGYRPCRACRPTAAAA